ncbi:dihydrofolate reductase family protein [Maritimibacter sp. DP1N21-5]|uniref:dihydrofolate reductase family protein n=1 Tax=Maritimibacter sp. DP1N21-5 TaxID=2836867 RepID=UPI001C48A2DB|nr:dihydrofolate reductase family protein [Maritimibacter sp. DP1N21-5]MBV7409054.1 dihydrofolate reductase family protein [Maritimibacter sp. DP1N21-5]
MAKLIFGMNMSLDGYVDHMAFGPGPALFQHFIDQTAALTGGLYGRNLYQIMSYWDEDQDGWHGPERAFARAWRAQPKWVVSTTLTEVGPNATLFGPDWEDMVRGLKAELAGDIDVAGPTLAHALGERGLVDEYRIYLHPVVLGSGTPFFAGARPRLRLLSQEPMEDDVLKLRYAPA